MAYKSDRQHLIITAVVTGQVIELPREYEDMFIAIMLNLLKDEMVLNAEVIYEDILDAEVIDGC